MGRKTAIAAPPLYHPAQSLSKGEHDGKTCHAIMTSMGRLNASHWGAAIAAALGRDPRTPEEALGVLGAFLRSDPAEKARFLEEAHAAWVRGGWELKGDSSPEAKVVLMALTEATRRLAERYGWKRGEESTKLRVTEEVAQRVVVVQANSSELPKEAVFRVGPQGLSQAALWKAAYMAAEGKTVYLVGPVAHKVKRMVLDRVGKLLAKATPTVRMPWGEEVRFLPGDRWEDPEAPEPRIAAAIRELRSIVKEWEEVVEEEEENEVAWVHQTQVSRRALKALWVQLDPEAKEVEAVYLGEEALRLLDGVEVDVYNPEEIHRVLGLGKRPSRRQPTGWQRLVEEIVRYGRFFTYREVKEVFEGKGKSWQVYRLLQPLVAWEVQTLGFKDPESAFQEGILEGVKVARRLKSKGKAMKVNPLVYLVAEVRKFLLELRAREVGVFRLSWREAKAVRRYFAFIKHGLSSREAAEKAGLPKELREALELGGELSADAFLEVGVDPAAEEVDYDTYLLRMKVREVKEEVSLFWGPRGEEFLELLMDGVAPYAAAYQLGLAPEFAEEVTAYLREQLEPWVEA